MLNWVPSRKLFTMTSRFGPYSPQELDTILNWLEPLVKDRKLSYSVIKDEQVENQFQKNSPDNVIAYTEIRTSIYLAQIFYIELDFYSEHVREEFFSRFVLKQETMPQRFIKSTLSNLIELNSLSGSNTRHKVRKVVFVLLLFVFLMAMIIMQNLKN